MASARQIARLVATTGSISSGAVRTALGRTDVPAGGLSILPELVGLVAETVAVASHADRQTVERVGNFLARLVLRYGTMRRTLEALAAGRRRHALISTEKAHAWSQAMSVSAMAIDGTLSRHQWLRIHLVRWATERGDGLLQQLADYEAWLDGPLSGADGEDEVPLLKDAASDAFADATRARGQSTTTDAPKPSAGSETRAPAKDPPAGDEPARAASDAAVMAPPGAEAPASGDLGLVRRALADKRPGDAMLAAITEDVLTAAKRLRTSETPFDRLVAAIALRDFVRAEGLMPCLRELDKLERETITGDRFYFEHRFEEALIHYRTARATRDDPRTRQNVAMTLLRRERGVRDDNLREAFDLLNTTVSEQPAGSADRGKALVVLGMSWMLTGGSDRSHAMHEAVRCFEQAGNIFDQAQQADWWAESRLHLAQAWIEMPTGDRFTNVERAIASLRETARVWTRDKHPERWANVQNMMGHAWERLPTADRMRTLEQAIRCFTAALEIRTRDAHAVHWARLQNNLGNAWIQFPGGDHKQNVERGIACHQSALEVWSELDRRGEWGATQSNLGNAWALLPAEDDGRERNMRRAIACYRSALQVRTRGSHPAEWAATQNNLGSALLHLPITGRGTNVREAIEAFEAALTVRTREQMPVDWARTQANLGLAWSKLPGDREDHLTEAVAYYESALEVFKPDKHPGAHKHVSTRLQRAKDDLAKLGAIR